MHLPEMVYGSLSAVPFHTPPSQSNYVVVCLRGQPNMYGRYSLEERHIRGFAECLDHCVEKHGLRVVFLPFQQGDEWGDELLHRQVLAAMKRPEAVLVRKWTGDFKELMECLGNARMIFAMRLHAAILGLGLRRPCILMPYDQKLDELGRQFGLKFDIRPKDLEEPSALMQVLDKYLDTADTQVTQSYETSWKKTVFHYFFARHSLN
jgi:polysaccharide pyruvyl transferase WcaK-like protein